MWIWFINMLEKKVMKLWRWNDSSGIISPSASLFLLFFVYAKQFIFSFLNDMKIISRVTMKTADINIFAQSLPSLPRSESEGENVWAEMCVSF